MVKRYSACFQRRLRSRESVKDLANPAIASQPVLQPGTAIEAFDEPTFFLARVRRLTELAESRYPETPPRPRHRPELPPIQHRVAHFSQRMRLCQSFPEERRVPRRADKAHALLTMLQRGRGAPRQQIIAHYRCSYPVSFQSTPLRPKIVLAPLHLFPSSASAHQLSRVDDMAALEGHGERRGFGIC